MRLDNLPQLQHHLLPEGAKVSGHRRGSVHLRMTPLACFDSPISTSDRPTCQNQNGYVSADKGGNTDTQAYVCSCNSKICRVCSNVKTKMAMALRVGAAQSRTSPTSPENQWAMIQNVNFRLMIPDCLSLYVLFRDLTESAL